MVHQSISPAFTSSFQTSVLLNDRSFVSRISRPGGTTHTPSWAGAQDRIEQQNDNAVGNLGILDLRREIPGALRPYRRHRMANASSRWMTTRLSRDCLSPDEAGPESTAGVMPKTWDASRNCRKRRRRP